MSNGQTLFADPLELQMPEEKQNFRISQDKAATNGSHSLDQHLGFVRVEKAERLRQFLFGTPLLLHLPPLLNELIEEFHSK